MISPLIKTNSNLSRAWLDVFLELMEPGGGLRHPCVVNISGFEGKSGIENPKIRKRLDDELKLRKKNLCGTVAGTIFPSSMWNPSAQDDATGLFERYDRAWPGISKCPANKHGVYFRRLTAFRSGSTDGKPVNQLKKIIDAYENKVRRKSALQAGIFDPLTDHRSTPYLGFPCLEQVTFTPLEHGRLSIAGFYAKQLHFEKSYGNYLGLYELGRFMAKHLGLTLTQVVCVTSCLEVSSFSAKELLTLKSDLKSLIHTE